MKRRELIKKLQKINPIFTDEVIDLLGQIFDVNVGEEIERLAKDNVTISSPYRNRRV